MSSTPNRKRYGSPMFFAAGLIGAAALAVGLDHSGRFIMSSAVASLSVVEDGPIPIVAPQALTEDDLKAARIAWAYIESNSRPETGLVDSVAGFASTTLWDQGSYLLGLVSAHRLGLVAEPEFHERADRFIAAFERIALVDGKLPNKAYNTQTLAMTDYANVEVDGGLGWSALDVARLLTAFRVLERHEPVFGDRLRSLLRRWDLSALSVDGELTGSAREGDEMTMLQEGRIGYEQYGSRGAAMWGIDVSQSISARRILEWRDVGGVNVPVDLRRASSFGAITPTSSEPYMLLGLEMGLSHEGHALASQVYRAQEARYRETGLLTMVSEDHVDQEPDFLYGSVFSNGRDWAVVSEDGRHFPRLRTVSVKAAFAWDALFGTEYTRDLREALDALGDEAQGWRAGLYEATGEPNDVFTLNTNAIVLEALHFKAYGPLWSLR